MTKFALGIKKQMLSFFASDGTIVPATLIATGPMKVVGLRTKEKEGYDAVLVNFGNYNREFRLPPEELKKYKVGEEIKVEFTPADKVAVTGQTKGKGFQGVVRRHGFHGGSRTHGQKHSEREPGAIGGGGGRAGGRVVKGMRMAGRMGGEVVTVKNLKILQANKDFLLVSGAVPGNRGGILKIKAI